MRSRHIARRLAAWLTLGLYPRWRLWRRRRQRRQAQHARRRRADWAVTRRQLHGRGGEAATTAAALATLAGASALTYSPQAEAISASSIANQVAGRMTGVLEKVFKPLFKTLLSYISGQNDKQVAAVGKVGDSINTTATELHNQKVLAAAEAPPDPCGSANLALDNNAASEAASVRAAQSDIDMVGQLSSRTAAQASNQDYRRVAWHLKNFGPKSPNPYADRSASWLSQTQLSPKDDKAVAAFQDNMLGTTRDADIALSKTDRNTREASAYEDLRATFTTRRSIAMQPILHARARRQSADGKSPSPHEADTAEVRRCYGNQTWDDTMDNFADPTPVVKEQARIMAFQSKLMLEQLEAIERGNLVLSTIALHQLEAPDNVNRLKAAYVQAAGTSDTTPLKDSGSGQ